MKSRIKSYTNVPSSQTYSSDENIWTLEERSDISSWNINTTMKQERMRWKTFVVLLE
jgi:hypothetical protein